MKPVLFLMAVSLSSIAFADDEVIFFRPISPWSMPGNSRYTYSYLGGPVTFAPPLLPPPSYYRELQKERRLAMEDSKKARDQLKADRALKATRAKLKAKAYQAIVP